MTIAQLNADASTLLGSERCVIALFYEYTHILAAFLKLIFQIRRLSETWRCLYIWIHAILHENCVYEIFPL